MSREIEDGMGFSGLVPTAAERRAEAAEMAVIERLNKAHMVTINRLTAERDEALRREGQARAAELEGVLRRVDTALDQTSPVLWKSLKTEVKRALGSSARDAEAKS